MNKLTAFDLFCGAGGLTEGLKQAGFQVLAAVDNAPLAVKAYRMNHRKTRVWLTDIRRLPPLTMADEAGISVGELDLLAGCPPCQGFSSLRTRHRSSSVVDARNNLVAQFARFAEALRPRALMMENVPGLAEDVRLKRLLGRLRRLGYTLKYEVLDAADYGVPQRRRRLVLLGLLGQEVSFAEPVRRRRTVRQAIGRLPSPVDSDDPLHNHGEQRSERIRKLIETIPAEGGFRRMGREVQLGCHKRTNGFYDIYGRMAWDEPAPTITGGCINPSKGRFLHPELARAITLREAALLQSFRPGYKFPLDRGKYHAADLIGNALPPRFVALHAAALANALRSEAPGRGSAT
ncbi:MAG TPA: DNA cytosine methyltransferase [Solirubrobacteraceae bacterium]|jgi:DNA (cytosine-5)-methyltransferase 1|nr:DNA cytosine methyltransferase [Solirubrobacteraceae bacterium]